MKQRIEFFLNTYIKQSTERSTLLFTSKIKCLNSSRSSKLKTIERNNVHVPTFARVEFADFFQLIIFTTSAFNVLLPMCLCCCT